MKIKALTSFSGRVCMAANQERDLPEALAQDLIQAGYAAAVKEAEPPPAPPKGKQQGDKP